MFLMHIAGPVASPCGPAAVDYEKRGLSPAAAAGRVTKTAKYSRGAFAS